ncbi:unnamed protein product [Prorocentrum cordatum]|uniref:Uncharacterized protein n=1 Tax=Prorocentrum cordatum TaxID=2364126 RepID=A0ABN9XTP3_9DINO|nr:unnamed protein product [Polarella glacialis]
MLRGSDMHNYCRAWGNGRGKRRRDDVEEKEKSGGRRRGAVAGGGGRGGVSELPSSTAQHAAGRARPPRIWGETFWMNGYGAETRGVGGSRRTADASATSG